MQKLLAGLLYGIVGILSLPPLRLLYGGSWLARLMLKNVFHYRREIIRKNISTSFPTLSAKEVRFLSGRYYHHLSQLIAESVKAMHWSVYRMKKRVVLSNPELLEELSGQGRDIVVFAGHTGNWEWLPALVSPYGFNLLGVYKPQTNKVFDRLTYMIRKKKNVVPISMRETARALKSDNNTGRPNALLLIADQIPAKPDINFWLNFLNKPTAWFTGGEKIAMKYNMPAIFMKMIKTGPGRYQGTAVPVSLEPRTEKPGYITTKYVQELENNINMQPENWLWSHRRWKHQPEDLSLHE